MRFDRMLFSSMMYPADYGFIPETLALDGDPLDVLVLVNEPTFPGCVMEVKQSVFSIWQMIKDQMKVICAGFRPNLNSLNDLSDMNPHLLKEIEHFFQYIKILKIKLLM
jgi:inorganic pyrophosphatase